MLNDISLQSELFAVAILVAGIVLARLASVGVGRLLGLLDRRTARLTTSDSTLVSPRLIKVSRSVVFWLVLVLAVSFALHQLGAGDIESLLAIVIGFVPQVLVAFTIVVAGHVLGLVARHVVASMSDPLTTDSLGPRMLHWAIVVVAIVMGLQHIEVDITFVSQLLLILVAIGGGGLMLAFALGSRNHVANLMARRELARFNVGDRIRVDGLEGEIINIHESGIELATTEGTAIVPASRLAESSVLRLAR